MNAPFDVKLVSRTDQACVRAPDRRTRAGGRAAGRRRCCTSAASTLHTPSSAIVEPVSNWVCAHSTGTIVSAKQPQS